MSQSERTLVLVKPDGVQRQLVGRILARFEAAELGITALELRYPEQSHIEHHYAEHEDKPFFRRLSSTSLTARWSQRFSPARMQ